MAEQPVNLRLVRASLRRRWWLVVLATLIGTAAGGWLLVWHPPAYSSTSSVLLAPQRDPAGQQAIRDMDTEVRVAKSDRVLGAAAPDLTRRELERRLDVTAPTTDVIAIVARAPTVSGAEDLANAVATSLVDYEAQATSSLSTAQRAALDDRRTVLEDNLDTVRGEIDKTNDRLDGASPGAGGDKGDATALSQLTAQQADLVLQIDVIEKSSEGTEFGAGATVIQSASPAERQHQLLLTALAGVVGGAIMFALALFLILRSIRGDQRLRTRDQVAGALGTPVLASVQTIRPVDQAGWRSLLATYQPDDIDDLSLRQVLLAIGLDSPGFQQRRGSASRRITVVSLAGDAGGLSVAAQLASHAAALGISTRFVAAGGHDSATTLEAACVARGSEEVRAGLWADTRMRRTPTVELTVLHVVVDRAAPDACDVRPTPRALLVTSAGSATAPELARAALWLHGHGSRVLGSIVADPDPDDRSSGRRSQDGPTTVLAPPARGPLRNADEPEAAQVAR